MIFGHDDRNPKDVKNYLEERNHSREFLRTSIIVLALLAGALLILLFLLSTRATV